MKYKSTKDNEKLSSLRDAVIKGLAPDGGLYFPEEIPKLSSDFLDKLPKLSLGDIAFRIATLFFGEDIPPATLKEIAYDAIDFPAPLVKIDDSLHILELFHGPTLAFKDFGARFMGRMGAHLAKDLGRELTVLVATSGDTGSAVAHGFLSVPGIRVVLLYPKGRISKLQEMQLTTLGENVTALEVEGSFDDCQHLVKTAFLDETLRSKLDLTSANSINIARLLPQTFYYFYAWGQLREASEVAFSVPSGNFGNLTAGLIAKRMGLPISKLVAATNINDIVPCYLKTGVYEPRPAEHTISNAMDVGDPSNFSRLKMLCEKSLQQMREEVVGMSFDDEQTKETISKVYEQHVYLLDPHGAVAYRAAKEYLASGGSPPCVVLGTAHPAKFIEALEGLVPDKISIPERLAAFLKREKQSVPLSNRFEDLKKYLLT